MPHTLTPWLIALGLLLTLSAFFSGSETSMLSANRYRLRHLEHQGNKKAIQTNRLLNHPDRLLSMILLGNTLCNMLATTCATIVSIHLLGNVGVLMTTCLLTLFVLIFAEVIPKTYAAFHATESAMRCATVMSWLMRISYPIVVLINWIAHGVLRCFGISTQKKQLEPLSLDELRSQIKERRSIALPHQKMLLQALSLENITANHIMITRQHIESLNIQSSWETITTRICSTKHSHLPLIHDQIDHCIGLICIQSALAQLLSGTLDNKTALIKLAQPLACIPESALITQHVHASDETQLNQALVVDEYGVVLGLITHNDIIRTICNEWQVSTEALSQQYQPQEDHSVLVSGEINLIDLNHISGWSLPTDGPRTLSGLIIDHLQAIPTPGQTTIIGSHQLEILTMKHNLVDQVRITPAQPSDN